MSAYALRDPRSGQVRYVGHSRGPISRVRRLRGKPHSLRLQTWFREMAEAGAEPILEVLGAGTEAEWIARLRPDLNINRGEQTAHEDWADYLMIRLPRDVLEEAKAHALADDRTVNSYVVKAVREQNRREKGSKR